MKKLLLVLIVILLTIHSACTPNRVKLGQATNESGSIPALREMGAAIPKPPPWVTIRFEAVVVNRPSQNCIEVFIPDEFEKYEGDPKWAIASTLGFELGLFETLPPMSRAIVTGKYIFVRETHEGPCGIVTGELFEISEIEYF